MFPSTQHRTGRSARPPGVSQFLPLALRHIFAAGQYSRPASRPILAENQEERIAMPTTAVLLWLSLRPEPDGSGSGCGSRVWTDKIGHTQGRGRPGTRGQQRGCTCASPTAPWSWCPSTGSATPTADTCSRWPSRPRAASGRHRRRNPQPAARETTRRGRSTPAARPSNRNWPNAPRSISPRRHWSQVLTYLEESHQLSILLDRKAYR